MAIAIDASTPVRWTGTPANNVDITSASFTAPADSVLVVCIFGDTNAASTDITMSVSDSSTLTWTNRVERDPGDASSQGGHASIFTAVAASSTSRTVSVRRTAGNGGSNRISVKCYVVTGADTSSPVGTTGEGSSTTNNITPTVYTSTVDNSRGIGAASDWANDTGATSTDTEDAASYTGVGDAISLFKAADTTPSSSAVTMNFDGGGTGASAWNWCAVEIKPAAGGGVALTGADSNAVSGTGLLSTSAALTSGSPTACSSSALLSATVPILAIASVASGATGSLTTDPQLSGFAANACSASGLFAAVPLFAFAANACFARAVLTNPGGGSPFPGYDIQFTLNRLAGTSGLDADGAANIWAGTASLSLVRALNTKAGTNGVELNGVCKTLADQLGGDPDLDGPGALSEIPT